MSTEMEQVHARFIKLLDAHLHGEDGKLNFSEDDIRVMNDAYLLAQTAHGEAKRLSGELYVNHPVAVAEILLDLGIRDRDAIVAALLHDVEEDTDVGITAIKNQFGSAVALLVEGLTKLRNLAEATREETQAQNVIKLLFALSRDPRVIVVKLADRVHNMRTLSGHPTEQKQRDIAKETHDIYVPIANILGIHAFKEELEDLSIRALDPFGYQEIEKKLALSKQDGIHFLERVKEQITAELRTQFPPETHFAVMGRVKTVHSIYTKMHKKNITFEEIHDLYAVRVIVDTVADCWLAFGYLNQLYTAVPNRFKNWIKETKKNGYQSIHNTFISGDGIRFEAQIRTWDMHVTAELGVAAHWKYKLGFNDNLLEKRVRWAREVLDSYAESDSVEEVVRTIKSDIAPMDVVMVFTPKGKYIELKSGATVVDFAYSIHTTLGHRMVGAKVNGIPASFDHVLQNEDTVEIIAATDREIESGKYTEGPKRDWLQFAKTSRARTKICAWFKRERRPENIVEGKKEIFQQMRRNFVRLKQEEYETLLLKAIVKTAFGRNGQKTPAEKLEDFYAAVGYGGISTENLMRVLADEYNILLYERQQNPMVECKEISNGMGVVVEGIANCTVKLAQCCHPLRGDPIIGYILRASARGAGGVSIHKRSCPNVPQ
ncbi:MAG: RelA/SpoT family protein, partial [Oscillospiraceae bacterium]|nr:RelA/SpoT family protein [Oscillospiraceae bacterium]